MVMLKNVHYDGKVVFGRRKQTVLFQDGKKISKRIRQQPEDVLIAEGKHPAIVDHDIFMLAQERAEGRGYMAPRTRSLIQLSFCKLHTIHHNPIFCGSLSNAAGE